MRMKVRWSVTLNDRKQTKNDAHSNFWGKAIWIQTSIIKHMVRANEIVLNMSEQKKLSSYHKYDLLLR